MLIKTSITAIMLSSIVMVGCSDKNKSPETAVSQEAQIQANETTGQNNDLGSLDIAQQPTENVQQESYEDVRARLDSIGPTTSISSPDTNTGKTSQELNGDLITELDSIGQPPTENK